MTDIIYTYTDEAPALATHSLLPIIASFLKSGGIDVESRDISLAARVMAAFPDFLAEDQRAADELSELGHLVKTPSANIIKLPNISASVPQLKAVIAELRAKGFAVPEYPDEPDTDSEREIKQRYAAVLGSAVNPVLREGNSDRRAPKAVKNYAQTHPHSMGAWSASSKTHVATMSEGDFRHNEESLTVSDSSELTIEFVDTDGRADILKQGIVVSEGDVVDCTKMEVSALTKFLSDQIDDARKLEILFSLHLKATMMKVSDPIIFGHAVRCFFADVMSAFELELDTVGVNVNNGLGNLLQAIENLPAGQSDRIREMIDECLAKGPALAMVNSDRGITNLHVPSDVIIDASMPAMIRNSGQMWNAHGQVEDTKAVIPDSSYAEIYQVVIDFCKTNGAFDPATMGTVPNVGLMAQKAEEYGSHDKTFEVVADGIVRVTDADGRSLFEHDVAAGDVWRMCSVKENAIEDWVKLAVSRARKHDRGRGAPAVFWLDIDRPHDAQLIRKVNACLDELDTEGLQIEIMSPANAMRFTLERVVKGLDTISVTGNVLRDYLTDLFPILELGTSAKMLSVVPLMAGGGLFETGAGGSAPKHVQQFLQENHLRWDSLGEFLAIAVSLDQHAELNGNVRAKILAESLDWATEQLLKNGKSPSRKVNELDNRGSHFYLAMYWAMALRDQSYRESGADSSRQEEEDILSAIFKPIADDLQANEKSIVDELNEVQGQPVDIGGYYFADKEKMDSAMRPSQRFNQILDQLNCAAEQH